MAESVRLFEDRARAALPRLALTAEGTAAVERICRRLDGLPLAIELAAARMSGLTPDQIADRLDASFALLSAGSRTAPPRHQTLRAAVDWSYSLLSASERALPAAAVGVRRRLDAGSRRRCWGRPEVLETLLSLVDKSLVQVERTARLGATVPTVGDDSAVRGREAPRARRD